ncbi:hypothetical protein A2U01_0106475, partial [Trifolium medium]|nr:hypothetical protein [Trifolium medium]
MAPRHGEERRSNRMMAGHNNIRTDEAAIKRRWRSALDFAPPIIFLPPQIDIC